MSSQDDTFVASGTVRQHIREEFERAHKLHERPRIPTSHVKSEISLAERAAPIFLRITATRVQHRRDGFVHEIVEPDVRDLNVLFDEALISLGFKSEVAR